METSVAIQSNLISTKAQPSWEKNILFHRASLDFKSKPDTKAAKNSQELEWVEH